MTSTKRQRELARRRMERQAAKRAAARHRRRRRQRNAGIVIGSLVAVLLLVIGGVALFGGKKSKDKVSADATCPGATPPTPEKQTYSTAPPVTVVPTKAYNAEMKTTCGTIQMKLFADKAPKTVNSFTFLAGHNYFDGTICHRLTTQNIFVLQCGDPTGTGSGGPGYKIPDENLPKASAAGSALYAKGVLAMANAGKGTGGSQFFIVYKETQLPPNYTIFGQVTSGLPVVEAVAAAGSDPAGDGKPKAHVVIDTFRITAK